MVIASINALHYGSTGKIMLGISDIAREYGNECYTFSKNYNKKEDILGHYYIGNPKGLYIDSLISVYSGFEGIYSRKNTKKLLRDLDSIKPDVIHLHNLHGWYLNFKMLFDYIKEKQIKTVWTLHDCWSFTGHCPYFDLAQCDKWMTGCHHCKQYREYPQSKFDFTKKMYRLKKDWFTGVGDMTIVTPSRWLAGLVKKSYLQEYPVKVINNGIDLSIFKPAPSDFRKTHHIAESDIVLLGVAFDWEFRKGLDAFLELAKVLGEGYRIVLVGTDDKIDESLPKEIISIHRTESPGELAEIYSAADFFVNPTREENYPTVNMEAIACGTPVITFNTGGSPESLGDIGGIVIEDNEISTLIEVIKKQKKPEREYRERLCEYAKTFDYRSKYEQYIELYREI